MSWLNKNTIFIFLGLFFIFGFLNPEIVFAESTCHGGAGGTLSTGINSGTYPEYYGIGKLVDDTYPNSLTCTISKTYTCPSGNTTKIYINYDTESGYDFVKIYNGAGSLLENISGNSGGYVWKGPYSSNTLKFGFTSDSSVTKTGFDIWKIECIAAAGLTTSCNGRSTSADTATLSPSTSWQTVSGSLSSGTDTKRYKVSVTATGNHEFSLCSADGGSAGYDSYLCLFNSAGTQLASDDDGCGTTASKITYNFTSTGTYYIQVSGYGTAYGSYTLAYRRTPPVSLPTMVTDPADTITGTSAQLWGHISNDGGAPTGARFVWGDTTSYGSASGWTADSYYTGQYFVVTASGLTKGKTYHFRIEGHNSAGYGYGGDAVFTTKPDAPSSFTATAVSSSQINLSWSKGLGAYLYHGQKKNWFLPHFTL